MDESQVLAILVPVALVVLLLVGSGVLYSRAYVAVEQGQALVIARQAMMEVSFTGAVVIPVVHRGERLDIRTKSLEVHRRGKDGLVCRDGVRADVRATFYVRVNKTAEDVLKVAQSVGCARAGDPATLTELFLAKFTEALQTVARQLAFEDLVSRRQDFREEVLQVVGMDLSGYVLDDLAIDHIEQTPLEQLDPNNILDAEGIRTITERTSRERIRRNELEIEMQRELHHRQLQLEEVLIELQRRKADALGRFREATGRELSERELQERVDEHVRALVRPVVEELLDRRLAREHEPPRTDPSATATPAPRA